MTFQRRRPARFKSTFCVDAVPLSRSNNSRDAPRILVVQNSGCVPEFLSWIEIDSSCMARLKQLSCAYLGSQPYEVDDTQSRSCRFCRDRGVVYVFCASGITRLCRSGLPALFESGGRRF